MKRNRQPKLATVRPGQLVVGMSVLSAICANRLAPTQFTVRRVEPPTADVYRPGEKLQSVELVDSRGFGGWETIWSRPEAIGPVFHVPASNQ